MRRRILWTLAALCALILFVAVNAYFILQSTWFYDQVRQKLITTVESATGGRVELASFHFNWKTLRAEARGFVLHGTEPAIKAPLFRASSIAVRLKLISILRHDIDIQSLDVLDPRVNLIIAPDGSTNFPAPKVPSTSSRPAMQQILALAIGNFSLQRGIFEIEAQSAIPFAARGQNLDLRLAYSGAEPRYHGTLAIQPLDLSYDDYGPAPFNLNLALSAEANRIAIESGRIATAETSIELKGALENLADPRAHLQYSARVALPDIARIFRVPQLRAGRATVAGDGTWSPANGLSLVGDIHATGLEYRDDTIRLVDFRATGKGAVSTKGVDGSQLRLSGFYAHNSHREPLEGRVTSFALRGKDIALEGIDLAMLNGGFRGEAHLRQLEDYSVTGEFSGIDARRTVAIYAPDPLPWDALVFGALSLAGRLHRAADLRVTGNLTLAPAPGGDPVTGHVNATYSAATGSLDLGRSTVNLPHSRLDASGSINHELKVHAESRDLNEILPAFGGSVTTLPVKLRNGQVVFDGAVTGNLDSPRIGGHLRATSFTLTDQNLDSFEGDVALSADYLRLQNASVEQAPLRAQLQGSIGLSDWKTTDASPISATATLKNAALSTLGAMLHAKTLPVRGTLSGSAAVNGTLATPRMQGDLELVQGAFYDEPFDRFSAHATYASNTLTVTASNLIAGAKRVALSGTFQHLPARFDAGHIHFGVTTNALPLAQVHTLEVARPGITGTLQVTARGDLDLDSSSKTPYRITDLHADLLAKSIALDGQPVGETHLMADSQGPLLRAHLESGFVGSVIRGDGQWRLEGEHPGTVDIAFSKLDLARLHPWLTSAANPDSPRYTGSTEGALHLEGPALNPAAIKATLTIPHFQLGPSPDIDIAAASLTISNAAPIVFRYANSIVTVESAHLVGRGTDLNLAGRVLTDQKSPLDLRLDGRLDLGFLQDFSRDFVSSGAVTTNVTVRGSYADPQIVGRMEFQKAAFNIVDVPNGISNASGAVIFTKERATIQSLSGETGGGKIDLSGFASYGGGPLVFRLHAQAREVRVRYPEGVSTVANASLNLTGTSESSMLSGTLTILRTGINLQSDFSSILAKSAEPVRTPSARPGLLGGMSFDVQIQTAPDIQLQSSLTENLQAEANLRLRGTASNPAVLGRINITQGKLTFFGTQYNLSQGTISFYNPVKVEPILNIDLEAKARGIDITLNVSGPLNKLALTPRSDPPLQFNEIVALLATGRTPTSDPSLLTQQSSAPQSWSQMGASALLGSAIANPVAGRLQRFFGVSKLRIDPTLSGVENNPQARLTLEQQITPAITFTYIMNVTTSNPQIIRVEWAFAKQWSVVALREENGLFGLDFLFKKRFK